MVPTAAPLLWRIEGFGTSYVYGTLHVADPRVLALPPAVREAIERCDFVYTETPMDEKSQRAGAQRLRLPRGETLRSYLPPDLLARLDAHLRRRGSSLERLQHLKPWVVTLRATMLEDGDTSSERAPLDQAIRELALGLRKQVDSLESVDPEALVTARGKYRPYRELTFDSAYPVVEGYKDTEAIGWHFQWSDPALLHKVGLTASSSIDDEYPGSEKIHVTLEYEAINWYARYWHNGADFYDLAGPTKRSRKGDAWIVGYDRALVYDEPRRLDVSGRVAYYTGLDTLPGNQNVSTDAIEDILSADLGLHYTNTRKSVGAVDHEKGYRWNLDLMYDESDFSDALKPYAGLDFGLALPWKHASVWLYNAAGRSNGEADDPLGNFYFGGFGNNYVDNREIKRYREYHSMPGFEIDELAGTDFVKTTLELNLPPVRFREIGIPSFFLKHLRPAIFASGLRTNLGDPAERTVASLGAQLDLEFTIAHRLPMTLSVGYAAGYESGERLGDEWMISLKIM